MLTPDHFALLARVHASGQSARPKRHALAYDQCFDLWKAGYLLLTGASGTFRLAPAGLAYCAAPC